MVQVPANLVAPIPNLRADPSLVTDVCSDITLDFGDTQNCARSVSCWSAVTDGTVHAVSTGDQLAQMASINSILVQASAINANSVSTQADSMGSEPSE
jgi:hypothetical protein